MHLFFASGIARAIRVDTRSRRTSSSSYDKGIAYLEEGELEKGETYFSVLVERDPHKPRYWFGLGLAKKLRGFYEEAIASWEKALSLDDGMWRCWEQLIQAKQKLGAKEAINSHLERLSELRDQAPSHSQLGSKPFFCRERIVRGDDTILAFQFFPGQESSFRFSMGDVKSGERQFTELKAFDYPGIDGLKLYAFCEVTKGPDTCLALFPEKPSYEVLRKIIVHRWEGKDRGPSTDWERKLFLKILPLIFEHPFHPWSPICRSWAVRFVSEIPDIVVQLDFSAIAPLIAKDHPQEALLLAHYTLAASRDSVANPKLEIPVEQNTLSALNALLVLYEKIREDGKIAFLEKLLRAKERIGLEMWLKQRKEKEED